MHKIALIQVIITFNLEFVYVCQLIFVIKLIVIYVLLGFNNVITNGHSTGISKLNGSRSPINTPKSANNCNQGMN